MKKNNMPLTVSIVVPVYNSAKILPFLVENIQKEMLDKDLDGQFEIILVNDASPDNSWQVICSLAKRYKFIKGFSLRKNSGQHNATMAGLNNVSGGIIVIMDDDLQHPPSAINDMVKAISEGYDVCYTHYLNRQHALWKKIGSNFNNWIASQLLHKPKSLYLSSFKAIRKEIVDEIVKYNGPFVYIDGLILDVTDSITMISVEHQARMIGEGNYNLRRSISLWLKMATSFSVLPLRLASFMGLLFATLSLVMVGAVFIQKLVHPEISAGWASLMATVIFFGGVQIFSIGLIGEYIGRTYVKLNGKPQFTIGNTTEKDLTKEIK